MMLALATYSAGRWIVGSNDTEHTACLLESLSHLHLAGKAEHCIKTGGKFKNTGGVKTNSDT